MAPVILYYTVRVQINLTSIQRSNKPSGSQAEGPREIRRSFFCMFPMTLTFHDGPLTYRKAIYVKRAMLEAMNSKHTKTVTITSTKR